MGECFGKFFVFNGEIVSAEEFDNSMVYVGESVYEVIRMKDGVPWFFSDHFQRLENSVRMQGRRLLAEIPDLRRAVRMLSSAEYFNEVNLKIIFNYNRDRVNWLVYFVKPLYPDPEEYTYGVKAILFRTVRENPGSKVINHSLRTEISQKLVNENAYEALLVNNEDCITEGSRSNLFFVRDATLFTAPDEYVLEGITRKYIMEICRDQGIDLVMKCVNVRELKEYNSVIMTGTSPVVLPFSQVGDMKFRADNDLISFLREKYLIKAEESRRDYLKGENS